MPTNEQEAAAGMERSSSMSETALLSMPFAGAVPMTASRVSGRLSSSAPGITLRDGKPTQQMRSTKPMADNRKYYYLKLKESYL